jgi:NADH:ubiquinone oxidoreductase subunit 6 (subunit J)
MPPPRLLDPPPPAALDLASLGKLLGDLLREFWPILVPTLLGLAAVYLLLPRVRRYPPLWGALLGGLALVLAGWWVIRAEPSLGETILFYAFSAVAVVAGVLLITLSNPVRAALSFALVVLSTCGLFLLQAAPFLMAATVIIYAGAIVVTFLFVIMLAQQSGLTDADHRSREPLLASVAGFVLLGGILCVLHRNYDTSRLKPFEDMVGRADEAAAAGSAKEMAEVLGGESYFKDFLKRLEDETPSRPPLRPKDREELVAAVNEAYRAFIAPDTTLHEKAEKLRQIRAAFTRARYTVGSLQPPGKDLPLSGNSGLRPNLPAQAIPTDARGKPVMPAQNVASLGQALFTDYVLGVELAGTLLLVAVIGAIAIAARRGGELR